MEKPKKRFISTTAGKVCIAVTVLAIIAACGIGYYAYWHYQQPKFHDLTIELGSQMPAVEEFLTEYANPAKARLVTTDVDLTRVGRQTLDFTHGSKEERVTLTIVDTTPPTATFQDVTASIDQALTPEDFVAESFDLSGTTVTFAQPLDKPDSYGSVEVELVVTDGSGNSITGKCQVFYIWIIDSFTLELGDRVEKADLLLDPEKDSHLVDQAVLDTINASPVGTYTVTSADGGLTRECIIRVVDTTAPALELKDVKVYKGEAVDKSSFFLSAWDVSGEVTVEMVTTPDVNTYGTQAITFTATDIHGNVTTRECILEVIKDTTGPTFSGVSTLTVEKYSTPNYTSGVSAHDNRDGKVDFTYDASKVNTSKAGTYYVTYSARDNSGNVGTYRRKVVVNHDAEDTAALVREIASGLSSDPEAIRDYVRSSIGYSSSWGGSDPVWYGFKNKSGNCYVHALCLRALLQEKGYTTQLIWVTDKSHYWLIINLNGTWRHIDATPSSQHSRYSLMTDEQRYETLSGRDWDRSAWPACE